MNAPGAGARSRARQAAGGSCLACGSGNVTPWAQARDVEYRSVAETYTYLRCGECAALSIDPVPMSRLREIYPANYYSFTTRGANGAGRAKVVYRVKNWLDRRWFRSMTRSIPGASLAALDVGGGTGEQLDALKAADARVSRTVIVDLDEQADSAARARGHEYVRARIEDAQLRGPFDVILLLNLIEHVADPLSVLQKVRSLLSPRGVVLVKTPNYDSLDARVFRDRNWGGYHCPRHWVIFTPASFERLIQKAGLRVQQWQYTQGAPFWTVSVIAWLADRSLLRVTRDRPIWTHPLYAPAAAAFAAFDFTRGVASRLSQMTFTLTADSP